MRAVNGIHWPNVRTWDLEQAIRCAGPTGAVTVLHHQLFERDELTGHHGDVENNFVYGMLRYGVDPARHGGRTAIPPAPERLIHIRAFERPVGGNTSWHSMYPEVWGRHIARKLSRWTGHNYPETNLWLDPYVAVSLANEQNIEGWIVSALGGERERRAAYEAIGRWNLTAWRALDDELTRMGITRRALSCWSALAFGHDMIPGQPDSEYTEPTLREAILYCDLLADHPYAARGNPKTASGSGFKDRLFFMDRPFRAPGVDGHALGGILSQFPGRALLITEANTFECDLRHRDGATVAAWRALLELAAASRRCVGVTMYMWHAGPEHGQNNIGDRALRDGLEAIGPIYTEARLPIAQHGGARQPAPAPDPAPVPTPPVVVEPPARPGDGQRYIAHTLRSGDTLWRLGGARWPELLRVLPMGDVRQLPVGAVVMIPEDLARERGLLP